IPSPYGLGRRHVDVLISDWLARDLSTAYIHNLISMLRVFAVWIRKPNLVPATADIIAEPHHKRREQVAVKDKSWSSAGIDIPRKLRDIAEDEPGAALALELMWVFGLRLKEASLLRPYLADRGNYLDVSRGTKGGRERIHPVAKPRERELLDRIKRFVSYRTDCLVPKGKSYRSWQDRVYYVLRKNGITRKLLGTSTHGLRHEYLNALYHELTGTPSAVRGGGPVDPELDRYARTEVAEAAGHTRPGIASCYLGRAVQGRPQKRVDTADQLRAGQCPSGDQRCDLAGPPDEERSDGAEQAAAFDIGL
ncbi:MAG: integrase domain-containing protein, partial [Sulfobacillus sp.]